MPFACKIAKFRCDDRTRARIFADFVERKQRAVNIQNRVFQALGDNRAGELLPPHDEGKMRFALLRKQVAGILQQQHITDEIEAGRVEAGVSTSRSVDGSVRMTFRLVGHLHAANIGSVNGKACCGFDKRLRKVRSREVPRIAVPLRQDAE